VKGGPGETKNCPPLTVRGNGGEGNGETQKREGRGCEKGKYFTNVGEKETKKKRPGRIKKKKGQGEKGGKNIHKTGKVQDLAHKAR